jgi:NADH:ubiquinone oxidoreductase subunit 6 (subunit J)
MVSTIIVYAGAIIVTFVFVIMLAQQQGLSDADARSREPFLASMTGFLLLCALLYILKLTYTPDLDRWVAKSGEKLEQIKALRDKGGPSLDQKKTLVRDLEQFRAEYHRWLRNEWLTSANKDAVKHPPPRGKAVEDALRNVPTQWDANVGNLDDFAAKLDLAQLEKAFEILYETGVETRNDPLLGGLQPNTENLSELSGPRSSRLVGLPPATLKESDPKEYERQRLKGIRRDAIGRPHLPAENTAYLGRSLFTDYLLSIELAGTLLLVATVGAIAIATRKGSTRFGSASANGAVPRRTA